MKCIVNGCDEHSSERREVVLPDVALADDFIGYDSFDSIPLCKTHIRKFDDIRRLADGAIDFIIRDCMVILSNTPLLSVNKEYNITTRQMAFLYLNRRAIASRIALGDTVSSTSIPTTGMKLRIARMLSE